MDSIYLDIMSFMNKWPNGNINYGKLILSKTIWKDLMIKFSDVYQVWSF
jgi:hypothetical protein